MITIVLAVINAAAVSLVMAIVCKVFGVRKPSTFMPTMFVLLAIGVIGNFIAERGLITENNRRLSMWEANQCVAPSRIAQSVFIADETGKDVTGTAFLVEGDTVVTNRHVSEAITENGMFKSVGGKLYRGMIFHRTEADGPDLAFYYAKGLGDMPRLPLARTAPQPGEYLLVVGNNGAREPFHPAVTKMLGVGPLEETTQSPMSPLLQAMLFIPDSISSLLGGGHEGTPFARTVYTSNGDTGPGNSGSPVVNCAGEVVGVHFAGRSIYFTASGQMAIAASLDDLTTELDKFAIEGEPTT